MTAREALEEVHKDLATAFGEELAERILTVALNTNRAPEGELDPGAYAEVLRSLCKDERVIGMYGELSVRDKMTKWEKLV